VGAFGAGLVVGNLALLAALAVLHRLVETESDRATGDRAVWYLIAFPSGFFLAAAYNTALFLALSAGAVYALAAGALVAGGCARVPRLGHAQAHRVARTPCRAPPGWCWRSSPRS
jgi:hypothetical protein